ncbi:hypothetical protein GCM10011326_46440 [Salipiger profundus]|uniref:hypothetical protein n=1 Tax=Salipiger profundus TaxID=1229727 RepID=UPI0009756B5C|nr:hypothetical protein [Salipiger profundus]GGA29154.1 hypothetical protein GCM10011326_46440 [Salipiger profundus]
MKHVDWDAVWAVYAPRVDPVTTHAELFTLFESVTDLLNDIHVKVEYTRTGRFARSGGRGLGIAPFDAGTFSTDHAALVPDCTTWRTGAPST